MRRGPRLFFRRIAAITTATLVGAVAAVVPQQSANAYSFIGCKWSTSAIKYYVPSPLISFPVWLGASASWAGLDATMAWANIASPHFYGTNEGRGNTVAWTGVTRARGTVQSPPSCPGGLFQTGQVEVVLNWTAITSYSDAQKQGVAAHELGHAFGLAHNSTLSGGVPVAIMYPFDNLRNSNGITAPKNDDKAGVNALY